MEYFVEIADTDLVPDIMKFINTYYQEDHVLSKNKELFEWQYLAPSDEKCHFVLGREKLSGNIIGVLGFIETSQYDNQLAADNCLWLSLWQVIQDTGIPSLGLILLQYLIEHRPHNHIAVAGINPSHKGMYKAMGYKVKDMRHHYLLNTNINNYNVAVVPKDLTIPIINNKNTLELELIDGESLLKIYSNFDFHKTRTPKKTIKYIYNRYVNSLFYKYKLYMVKDVDDYLGVVVARECQVNAYKVLRLVDFLVEPRCIPYLANPLNKLIQNSNYEYVDFFQIGLNETELSNQGFLKIEPDSDVVIPNYFEPFVRKNCGITICFRGDHADNFIAFKADGDQDRPSILN